MDAFIHEISETKKRFEMEQCDLASATCYDSNATSSRRKMRPSDMQSTLKIGLYQLIPHLIFSEHNVHDNMRSSGFNSALSR